MGWGRESQSARLSHGSWGAGSAPKPAQRLLLQPHTPCKSRGHTRPRRLLLHLSGPASPALGVEGIIYLFIYLSKALCLTRGLRSRFKWKPQYSSRGFGFVVVSTASCSRDRDLRCYTSHLHSGGTSLGVERSPSAAGGVSGASAAGADPGPRAAARAGAGPGTEHGSGSNERHWRCCSRGAGSPAPPKAATASESGAQDWGWGGGPGTPGSGSGRSAAFRHADPEPRARVGSSRNFLAATLHPSSASRRIHPTFPPSPTFASMCG